VEESEIDAMRDDAQRRTREELPTLGVTIVVAILIWVFGTFVFVPLAKGISFLGQYPLDTIISVIILVALIIVILRAFASILRLSTGLSEYSAVEIGRRYPESMDRHSVSRIGMFLRSIIYVVVIVLIFVLLQGYLNAISPILTGVILLIITIVSVILLYNGGASISSEVARLMEGAATKTASIGKTGVEKATEGVQQAKQETRQATTPPGQQTPA
jgi:hypothetical protein